MSGRTVSPPGASPRDDRSLTIISEGFDEAIEPPVARQHRALVRGHHELGQRCGGLALGLARIGETTRVGTLAVTPLRVVEDSRCPINARCIWAGRLILTTAMTLSSPASINSTGDCGAPAST